MVTIIMLGCQKVKNTIIMLTKAIISHLEKLCEIWTLILAVNSKKTKKNCRNLTLVVVG